jgi:hypothetical protein
MTPEDELRAELLQVARERYPDLDDHDLALKIRASFPDDGDEEAG